MIFGNYILSFLDSKSFLPGILTIGLFSFSTLITRNSGFQLNLANQANKVIEHISTLYHSIFYFGTILIFIKTLKYGCFLLRH